MACVSAPDAQRLNDEVRGLIEDSGPALSSGRVVPVLEVCGRVSVERVESADWVVGQTVGANARVAARDPVPKSYGEEIEGGREQKLTVIPVPEVDAVAGRRPVQRIAQQHHGRDPVDDLGIGPVGNRGTLALADDHQPGGTAGPVSPLDVSHEQLGARRNGAGDPQRQAQDVACLRVRESEEFHGRAALDTRSKQLGQMLYISPCSVPLVERVAVASEADHLDVAAGPLGRGRDQRRQARINVLRHALPRQQAHQTDDRR